MKWTSQASANIALIKYMGKSEASTNTPANGSLSYTLDYLSCRVEIEQWTRSFDGWESLTTPGFKHMELSKEGTAKFLRHFQSIKDMFLHEGNFVIRSANNFPADCGVASSAASFAALTKAACQAMADLTYSSKEQQPQLSPYELARISQKGSGSSCRSFFPDWVVWKGTSIEPLSLPQKDLIHILAVVNDAKKIVSSSSAHLRVTSSLLFSGRVERAEKRLAEFVDALKGQNWERAFEISWAEFWDMHALFETSEPSFGYMSGTSLNVLNVGRKMWQSHKRGPLITMDAGANVHFLFLAQDRSLAFDLLKDLKQYGAVLTNLDESTSLRHG